MIVLCVRWYLRFSLSYRDLEELMAERNLSVDHTTVWRWVQHYAPKLNKRLRREVKPTNGSWRTDETYIRVAGRWTYLYRAVDSTGATIDFLLSETRDLGAARRFFQKALTAPGHPRPRVITVDGNPSYPAVIQELKRAGALGRRCRCRLVPYLNNIIEQDHRAIKRRINAKLGFRIFRWSGPHDPRLRSNAYDQEGTSEVAAEGRCGRAGSIHQSHARPCRLAGSHGTQDSAQSA